MDMPTVIRISRPEDLLAYIPYSLGFRPRESAVLVGMRAGGPRLGLATRVDLAALAHPHAGPELVAEIATFLARDGCDDAFVVLYTDEPRHALADHPVVRPALDVLRERSSWTDPPGPWVVGAGTYGCWGEGEECATAAADLADLEKSWLAATMVLHGKTVAADRGSLQVPRTAHEGSRRAAVRAARRARAELVAAEAASLRRGAPPGAAFGVPGTGVPDPLDEWRDLRWRSWRRLVSAAAAGRTLPPAELGALAVAMHDPRFRDGVLYSLARPMPRSVPTAVMAVTVLDDVMGPGGPPPSSERVDPAETVLRAVVGGLGAATAAHALAALAWLAWWSGDGARADVMSLQVLKARPGTRLAELVQQALSAHLAPGWVSGAPAGSVPRRSFR